MLPLCVPELHGNEWAYIQQCLESNWVSSAGPFVDRFETEFATYIGTPHAVATVNGTAALHIALLVAGVKPDDEVLVSDLTFIASANAIRYVGAWPVFIDVEPDYWQMDPTRVTDFLQHECEERAGALYNRTTGRRVSAIVPVHILGHPVDMDPIIALARAYHLVVIEDAAESLGARYRGRHVGQLGDIACFSFNGNKVITTGGGGMLVTENATWAQRARYLTTQAKDDPLEFEHRAIGYNYRLPNILAALGCAQLEVLDGYLEAKRHIASLYTSLLAGVPGITPMRQALWAESIFWLYTIRIDPALFGMDSRQVLHELATQRIQTRSLWQPMHLSPAHAGCQVVSGAITEVLYREALSLPCSVGIEEENVMRVAAAIQQCRG